MRLPTNRKPSLRLSLRLSARRLFDRFWAIAGAVSVRTKILGIVLALVLLLGGGVTLQVRSMLRVTLRDELHNQGVSIARDVAARSVDLLLVHDLYSVHQLLQDTLINNEDVRYAFIVSPEGEVLAHTFGERFPSSLTDLNSVAPTARYHLLRLATEEGMVWDFAVPVFDGRAGIARIGLSEQAMQSTLDNVTRQLLLTTIIVSLAGVAAAMFLTWLITRPVLDLVKVTRAVARGDLSRSAPRWADDEIGRLSDSFNTMIADLSAARAETEAYNTELLRRNRELAVLNEIAQTVSRQQDLGEMLDKALHRVLDLMNKEAGWIVLSRIHAADRRLACSLGLPEDVARQEAEIGFRNCQCRQIVEQKVPLLISPLTETCPLYQLRLRSRHVVDGHVAVPLIAKSEVLGALNIACSNEDCFSDDDLRLLGAVGQQLGVAVENARLWTQVRQKETARGQLLEKIITAQEEERKRIARELHDDTSQSLTSLMVGLKALENFDSYDEVRQHISGLRDIAAETLETVHDLALELRPSVLDDLGLAVALERYLSDYQRRFDIAADYRTIGLDERRLAPAIETTLYRIVQEALTNVVRHSAATHVSVLLEQTSQHVRVIVEDNGSGFDTSTDRQERNLGLYGMEERATLIGGSLRIEAEPGMGTTIVVHVPLTETLVDPSRLEKITTPKIASVVENRVVRGVT